MPQIFIFLMHSHMPAFTTFAAARSYANDIYRRASRLYYDFYTFDGISLTGRWVRLTPASRHFIYRAYAAWVCNSRFSRLALLLNILIGITARRRRVYWLPPPLVMSILIYTRAFRLFCEISLPHSRRLISRKETVITYRQSCFKLLDYDIFGFAAVADVVIFFIYMAFWYFLASLKLKLYLKLSFSYRAHIGARLPHSFSRQL